MCLHMLTLQSIAKDFQISQCLELRTLNSKVSPDLSDE